MFCNYWGKVGQPSDMVAFKLLLVIAKSFRKSTHFDPGEVSNT